MNRKTSYLETGVSNRKLAIEFTKHLPLEDSDFRRQVDACESQIAKLPKADKIALRCAFLFAHKLPREEREDAFQEFTSKLLKAKVGDEKLAYAICRCDWKDYFRKLKTKSQFQFVSIVEEDEAGMSSEDKEKCHAYVLSETLVGECEFENKLDGKMDADRIWTKLPTRIKRIVARRLAGFGLPGKDRVALCYWLKTNPMLLASEASPVLS